MDPWNSARPALPKSQLSPARARFVAKYTRLRGRRSYFDSTEPFVGKITARELVQMGSGGRILLGVLVCAKDIGPFARNPLRLASEQEFQTKLDQARISAGRRGSDYPEILVVGRATDGIRRRELRPVKKIEKFGAEFQP